MTQRTVTRAWARVPLNAIQSTHFAPPVRRSFPATHRPLRPLPARVSGVPGRFILAVVLADVRLQVAVLGMYLDIGYHIDHGRDQGVFIGPHMFIVGRGLQGIVLAALAARRPHGWPGPRRRDESPPAAAPEHEPGRDRDAHLRRRRAPRFPLDAFWAPARGVDVTLWGPTHLFMIGGARRGHARLWMVMRQGFELGARARSRGTACCAFPVRSSSGCQPSRRSSTSACRSPAARPAVLIAFAAAVRAGVRTRSSGAGAPSRPSDVFVIRIALALFVGQSPATRRRPSRSTSPRRPSSSSPRSPRRAAAALRAAQRAGHRDDRPRSRVGWSHVGWPIRGPRRCSCPPSCLPWPPPWPAASSAPA